MPVGLPSQGVAIRSLLMGAEVILIRVEGAFRRVNGGFPESGPWNFPWRNLLTGPDVPEAVGEIIPNPASGLAQ